MIIWLIEFKTPGDTKFVKYKVFYTTKDRAQQQVVCLKKDAKKYGAKPTFKINKYSLVKQHG